MGKISIYVMTHKEFDAPLDPVYVPMQVGAALHEDLGFLRDDTKENISEKNPNFCELTGLYWAWKNDYKSDYIGLCHYRRYFLGDDSMPLSGAAFKQFFKTYPNVLVVSPRACTMDGGTVRDFYISSGHKGSDLDAARDSIMGLYPDYIEEFDATMSGSDTYFANMVVGKKSIIDEYCKWLFDILFDMEKNIDISGYDAYNKRVFGFVSERLFTVWIRKNQIPVQECMVNMVDDFSK